MKTKSMGWDPKTGESTVFDSDEERKEKGFLDHHPGDDTKGDGGKPNHDDDDSDKDPMTREELEAALNEGKINYSKNASDRQLENALKGSLRKALTARDIKFEKSESTRELLAKIKGQQ